MLEARELTKTYGSTTGENRPALDRLTLFVPGGKIFCLLGPNGADKTTTINLFLNFIEPTSGEAIACGANAAERADIVGYGLFWTLLAAAIKGRRMDSALNALTLMTCFVVVTLILPAAINAIASAAYPPPSRAEMVLAARAATTDADREQDAALARYADEHPDALRLTEYYGAVDTTWVVYGRRKRFHGEVIGQRAPALFDAETA